ncbi:Diaminopimelate epimerase-like protein [Hymenopellis radicata]|nr:Diaminopimelate epimerase-like protein [Hymenopellis radicata]
MLNFCTLDVFTTNEFYGNPLAIVHVPYVVTLSNTQKQTIAREFNYSETIFLHEEESKSDTIRVYPIDIFTVTEELPFAGHPTVGAGWYLLQSTKLDRVIVRTKAGDILVRKEGDGVRLKVPIDFKTHAPYTYPLVKSFQKDLRAEDFVNGLDDALPVVSIVKGMSFVLLELTSVEALEKMQPYVERIKVPDAHLGEWKGFSSIYVFVHTEGGVIRTRMFEGSFEDPATGSAASTLCGWLAEAKGDGQWSFDLVQGVEIGRRSEIQVFVEVAEGKVQSVELAGDAVQVMEGKVKVPKV